MLYWKIESFPAVFFMSITSIMYRGPGAFGFSLTSDALRDNPEVPSEWERGRYNRKKAVKVAREIERIAREAEVGGRWFHYFNPDLMDTLTKAFPHGKYPSAEGEVSDADIEAGVAQVEKYIIAEGDRFNARKQGVYEDEYWKNKRHTAAAMLEEWGKVQDVVGDALAPPVVGVVDEDYRPSPRGSPKGSSRSRGSSRSSRSRSSSRSGSSSGSSSPKTRRRCPGGTGTCPKTKKKSSKRGKKQKRKTRRRSK